MSNSKEILSLIRNLIKEKTGITYKENKDYFLELKLAPLLKKAKCAKIMDFYNLIKSLPFDDNLFKEFIDAITINETSFFRDGYPFDILRIHIFPRYIQEKKNKKIRIMSVPSSTGQEPYSIVMTALEVFPDIDRWDFKIVSGDISEYALFRAKQGRYRQIEVARGLNAYFLGKYFTKINDSEYEIKKDLKKYIEFHKINVLDKNAIIWKETYDIVFFRNIMIYFDLNTQKELLSRIKDVLKKDGYLFIGSSEVIIGISKLFKIEKIDRRVIYVNSK